MAECHGGRRGQQGQCEADPEGRGRLLRAGPHAGDHGSVGERQVDNARHVVRAHDRQRPHRRRDGRQRPRRVARLRQGGLRLPGRCADWHPDGPRDAHVRREHPRPRPDRRRAPAPGGRHPGGPGADHGRRHVRRQLAPAGPVGWAEAPPVHRRRAHHVAPPHLPGLAHLGPRLGRVLLRDARRPPHGRGGAHRGVGHPSAALGGVRPVRQAPSAVGGPHGLLRRRQQGLDHLQGGGAGQAPEPGRGGLLPPLHQQGLLKRKRGRRGRRQGRRRGDHREADLDLPQEQAVRGGPGQGRPSDEDGRGACPAAAHAGVADADVLRHAALPLRLLPQHGGLRAPHGHVHDAQHLHGHHLPQDEPQLGRGGRPQRPPLLCRRLPHLHVHLGIPLLHRERQGVPAGAPERLVRRERLCGRQHPRIGPLRLRDRPHLLHLPLLPRRAQGWRHLLLPVPSEPVPQPAHRREPHDGRLRCSAPLPGRHCRGRRSPRALHARLRLL